jgi:hypothetical protein
MVIGNLKLSELVGWATAHVDPDALVWVDERISAISTGDALMLLIKA